MIKRFFLDSNVYDEFLKSQELLDLVLNAQSQGLIELVGTHIEPDQLQDTNQKNPSKGIRLVSAHLELNANQVDTEGLVLDVNRLDMARLFSDEDAELFTKLTANNPKHSEDILMIFTAKREEAVFVTQDKRIPSLCIEIGIECINAQALGEWCYQETS